MNILNNSVFCSKANCEREIDSVDFKILTPENFKIFPIMDLDDCSSQEQNDYKNKNQFNRHWAKKYIHPIYNNKNLEDVFIKCNIASAERIREINKDYSKLFPLTEADRQKNPYALSIEELVKKLEPYTNNNLDKMINYFLNKAKNNSFQK